MKRILAAVQDDPLAPQIVHEADVQAQLVQGALTICHVMDEDDYQHTRERLDRERHERPFTRTRAEQAARSVAEHAADALRAAGRPYASLGLVGEPVAELLALAERLEADLIVMGFQGHRGLERLRALGSVSRALLEDAPCPVYLVPVHALRRSQSPAGRAAAVA